MYDKNNSENDNDNKDNNDNDKNNKKDKNPSLLAFSIPAVLLLP